eukprot:CAMPEP_0116866678 /NCGR_PEP_ID=MMETSP0418-20121206/26169_1 /TAXON_ID=1158023 /ORGANISM="Astrosyne radiata, Strain 13vi08-1A" /LENGTH=44 /DNA_ID= /DNA_START= /DNA_END= /DNA_ORIENTATION=
MEPQIRELARASHRNQVVDVVVATPGRLVDVLTHYDEGSRKAAR